MELKQGVFRAEYKGQMELYLRWLARYEREEGEALPLGIILCAGASAKQVEVLELDAAGIHVAEYLTILPPQDALERKLKDAATAARQRFESDMPDTGTDGARHWSISPSCRKLPFLWTLRRTGPVRAERRDG